MIRLMINTDEKKTEIYFDFHFKQLTKIKMADKMIIT